MKKYDVIIIGAGPAGIITGVTAKKQFPEKTVLMIKKEEKGLVPCGIPYIFHNLNSVEKNAMGPKPFIDLGGDVLTDSVIKVDIEEKKVEVKSGDVYSFEKLVFATGSESIVASFIKGHELENVFYIKKSYNYINNLFNEIKDKKNIVVVGGGFIGVEVAEQLSLHKDKKVSLVELEEYCFSKAFSDELSEIATKNLENTDIEVYTSTRVDEIFGDNGKVKGVKLSNGKVIDAEVVILAVGYKSETSLAKNANVQINECGAISVDNYGRTTNNDVFAVGDCSQTIGFMTGRSDMIMLASTATAEARVVGYNLFGVEIKNSFTGTIGIFSTKIANLSMAAAGLNEKNAVPANIDFISAKFSDVDKHPGTITGTMPLTVKLYVSPSDGTLLGGEVWGAESAGEIINTIGLAIQKSLTVYELISLQIGTHPLLTSAPTKPLFVKAAEVAFNKIKVL
ncbi:MAG: FAD-dependent oxidoreductase, partial [Bacteroidota bacterium]|nr:FAD-dependent oxidoreductase [Bacteroidota bacterium]